MKKEMNTFAILKSEIIRAGLLPDGPVRLLVVPHDPDEVQCWRWLMKEGEMVRPFQAGDKFIITQEMQDDIRGAIQTGSLGLIAKCHFQEMYPVFRKIRLQAIRLDRFLVFLRMEFPDEGKTCAHFLALRKAGFVFTEPDSPELSLTECPVDLLSPREKVLRGLIELHECDGWVEEEALQALAEVDQAMQEYDVVFYEP